MEKRVLVAVLLMSIVIIVSNLLFPPEPPQPAVKPAATASPAVRPSPAVVPGTVASTTPAAPADTIVVRTPLAQYAFSTNGAKLLQVELPGYESHAEAGRSVQLIPAGADLLTHAVASPAGRQDLSGIAFQPSARSLEVREGDGPRELRFTAGGAEIVYTFRPDAYTVGVRGRVAGVGPGASVATGLGTGLANHEANPAQTRGEMALVLQSDGDVDNITLDKIKAPRQIDGPLEWVGVKNKYFLAALVAPGTSEFSGVTAQNVPDARQVVRGDTVVLPRAAVAAAVPIAADGSWRYDAYLGPQVPRQLAAAGRGLDEVNPYGYRWLRPIVRPIAAVILWAVAVLHDTVGLSYGWVLIALGVLVKLITWPLNAKAMRAQLKNLEFQPLMQEIQTKYKGNPEKQQQEMMKLYKEKGFNPLSGCMPLLIPMPVFITLFFVLQTAIEFRGVNFMWLPDLSLPDPYYILPVLFMASTLALQWISTTLSGMEQTAQLRMTMYLMPLIFGVFFFTVASGLNLYYLASNVAGFPQQILIARARRRAQADLKESTPKPAPAPTPGNRGVKRPPQRAKRRR